MATFFTRFGRIFGGLCLSALLTASASGQDFLSQPPRARQMLKNARELYARGEYDAAAQLYQQASQAKESLTPNEQADLATQMQQNATAQKARQDGLLLLESAEASLTAGKGADAEAYARLAQANQFLSVNDKQRLQSITQGIGQLKTAQADLEGKSDPSALLTRAREALRRGDFDTAEMLARQAEKSRSIVTNLVFWADSPSRVLDDVRLARSRAPKTPAAPVSIGSNLPSPNSPPSLIPGAPPSTALDNTSDPKNSTITNYSPTAPAAPGVNAKAQARQLVMDGYKALEANNLDQARIFANQAKELRADLEWWEPNPEKLMADINRRTTTNDVVAGNGDFTSLMRQGRAFYLQQRYDDAERLATQAEALNRRTGLFEDSPKKLKEDIARARGQLDADKAGKLTTEARRQIRLGNYAEAKNLAQQAKTLGGQSSSFWTWSDTPDAILRDVARLERNNPQPAVPGPAVPPAPLDPSTGIAQANGTNPLFTPPPGAPGDSLESAQLKMQAKGRAIQLVAEARQLERQGHLVEARAKAVDAQGIYNQWSANEENPAAVLRDLDTRAATRIKSLLDQATEIVNGNPADSTRFQKADGFLVTARRLAEAFRQDTAPIDHKIQWLQLAASQSRGTPMAAAPSLQSAQTAKAGGLDEPSEPTFGPGHQDAVTKLNQARLELKAGNTVMARRLAEDAFGVSSVREDAQKVLRSIDAEEHAQTIVSAQRNYQAGMDAFKHKDFRKAASIFANVDVRLLQPDQARKVGEIIDSPEMRGGLQLTANNTPAPVPAGIDRKEIGETVEDPHLSAVRQMQKIQAGKFRDLRLAAESRANELAKSGQEEQAIEVLQDYQIKLRESGMDAIHTQSLSRPVEDRIQKLRTVLAQKEIERERKVQTGQTLNMTDRSIAQLKVQEKVAELLKRGNQRYKEGKYDEARAEATKVKELDPDNVSADALLNMATLRENRDRYQDGQKRQQAEFIDHLDSDPGLYATYKNPLRANKDMLVHNISNRKDTSVQSLIRMNSKEQMIERKLSQPTTLNFQDLPLYRVLQDLQVISGINIVADKAALSEAGISLEQPLSLTVDNISLKSALNLLLKQVRLTYVIKNEVLEITTISNAQGKQRMVTYSIADLVIPVDDHSTSDINNFEEALKRHISSTGGGVRYTPPVPFTGPQTLQNGTPVGTNNGNGGSGSQNWNVSKSNGNTIEHLVINLITNTISPNTWESTGGDGRIQYFPLGHALVVSQVQEVQEEVQALLNALRRLQDIQISIEMRVVSVSEKFFERIGLDFDVNIRTPQYRVENQLVNGSYAPFGQVNRNLGVTNVVSGLTPAGQLTPDLNVPLKSSSFDFSVPPFGGFPGTLGADGGLSLGLAFLSDIQVFMFLEAAQGDQRTHVMQAPKLTVFNGQTANINVQDQMFFLTGVSIAQAGSQTFFVPQNQPFPVGVGMQVTPVVSADRRFVRLNLFPQLTNLITANIPLIPVQIPIPQLFDAPNGQGFISGQPVIFQMFFQQPSFTTINVNTTVNVPDGGTVLLGGLKTMAEGRNEFGPPILSKIPYLSRLFRNQAFGRESQSIMIMVTPRIIINEEIEQEILGEITPIPR